MPLGSFGNVPDRNISSEDLADAFARLLKEVTYLLNGGLDTLNVNELSADVINAGVLNAGLVTVRADYAGGAFIELSVNGIRINDGLKDTLLADTSGNLTLIGRILSSVIIGSEIKTSESEYPRVTISSTSKLISAESSATESIQILADDAGQPAIHLDNATVQGLIHANALAAALIINTVVGKGKIQLSSGGDLELFAESTAGKVKFDSWSKVQRITAPVQTLQQALDGKANAFTGFTGSFSTGTQTVTVNNGIITSVV